MLQRDMFDAVPDKWWGKEAKTLLYRTRDALAFAASVGAQETHPTFHDWRSMTSVGEGTTRMRAWLHNTALCSLTQPKRAVLQTLARAWRTC